MKRLLFLTLLWPTSLAADPVSIRSGEHDSFSRFVLTIGEGTDWAVEPTEGGFILDLSSRSDGFDTSTVFDRIPRDRVANVSQIALNRLFFAVDCACSADAFLWQSDQLVVDIVDGVEFLEPLEPQTLVAEANVAVRPEMPADSPQRLPDLLALRQGSFTLSLTPTGPTETEAEPDDIEPLRAPVSEDVAEAEVALAEGLARAASQGFLNPNVADTQMPVPPEEASDTEEIAPPEPMLARPQHPGIGITTALDREMALVRGAIGQELAQNCLPADMFQLDQWGSENTYHSQVADLAEALAGEFGEEPREAQDTLARLNLYFGFGAEARAVLSADPAQSQSRAVLLQLAGMIDEYEGEYPLISAQAGCDTPAALWAFIAAPHEIDDDSRNHILQSLFALPQPLRGHIAPRLSRGFLDIGETDAAERSLRAVNHEMMTQTHDAASTRAQIAEQLDEPEVARAVLAAQASENPRTTPASVIRLIELGIETGMPVNEADLVLAAALRQEHRNTPLAAQLALAEAAGHTQMGQYQAALDLIIDREDALGVLAVNTTFAQMTQNSDAATFLGFAFADVPQILTADTENAIAARLIDLGFPERASNFLTGPAQREAAAERRYLRATAAIGTADYADALDSLLGMTTPRANDLRARAFAGLGEHRAALESSNTDAPDGTLEFRANAWERLSVDNDTVLSTFAQSVLAEPSDSPATSLADRRAVLAQSQDSRRAVEELLLRFDGTIAQE